MTIEEANKFYQQDKKEYLIKNNKEFLNYLNLRLKGGYSPRLSLDEMQKLINEVTKWYETKYPNREFDRDNGCFNIDFTDTKDIANYLSFDQLLFRLPSRMINFIKSPYRYKGAFCVRDNVDGKESFTSYSIVPINNEFDVHFNLANGLISNAEELMDFLREYDREVYNIVAYDTAFHEKYLKNKEIYLSDLIKLFSEDELDEVKKCLNIHNTDLEIRNYVLKLISLSLLYSKNTIPEYGALRAKKFIDEFNKELGVIIDMPLILSSDSLEKGIYKVKKQESN